MNKRKIGFFFLAFAPVLLAQAVQFFAIIFVYGVSAVTGVLSSLGTGNVRSALNQIFYMFSDYNFTSFIMIIYSIIIICCFGLWYYTRLGGEFKPDFKNNFNMYKLLGIILLVPGAQFLSSVIANITALIMPSWMQSYEELFESAGFESDITIVLFLYSVIFAPVCEELIFRGVTMNLAKAAVPFWAANLLQAFLFGAYHLNWIQGIYAFALGLMLGYVCERCGKIYYSIAFHMMFNFWGTVVSGLLPDEVSGIIWALLLIGMILSLILGFIFIHKGCKRNPSRINEAIR